MCIPLRSQEEKFGKALGMFIGLMDQKLDEVSIFLVLCPRDT